MSIDNFPSSEKDYIDILAKSGYLKVENDNIEVSLDSSDTLNIQPKNNIFGLKVTVEEDNSITPTLTFDTRKLKDENDIDYKKILDDAIENLYKENNV
jgi:septum formation topological specificity factor MinE